MTLEKVTPVMMSTLSFSISFLDELRADVGLELVVLLDHRDRDAAELAAVLLHREHERVVLILAERGAGSGKGGNVADFDFGPCRRT